MTKSGGKKVSAPATKKKKAAKVVAKSSVLAKKASKKRKIAAPALSSAARQAKVKPPEDYGDLVKDVVAAWQTHRQILRIDGRSPARLGASLRKAEKVREKEEALRKQLEAQLRPLTDARILAEESMWLEVLDLYRVVKAMTPMRPELEKAFEVLTDHFSRPRATQPPPQPNPMPQVATLRDGDLNGD